MVFNERAEAVDRPGSLLPRARLIRLLVSGRAPATATTRLRSGAEVFNNTDYPDWDTAQRALANYITHRNGADRDRRVAALERKHRVAAEPACASSRHRWIGEITCGPKRVLLVEWSVIRSAALERDTEGYLAR
jgi:hypothetical protein